MYDSYNYSRSLKTITIDNNETIINVDATATLLNQKQCAKQGSNNILKCRHNLNKQITNMAVTSRTYGMLLVTIVHCYLIK